MRKFMIVAMMIALLSASMALAGCAVEPVDDSPSEAQAVAPQEDVAFATTTPVLEVAPPTKVVDAPLQLSPIATPVSPVQRLALEIGGGGTMPQPGLELLTVKGVVILSAYTGKMVSLEDVEILEMEEVEWSDASLGCPSPEMMYAQVITPGYKIVADFEGDTYEFHTDTSRRVVLCSVNGKKLTPPVQ